jgi:hypothetical protein
MRSFPRWILALGALALTLVPTISTASPASVADLDALARAAAREPLERAAAFRASLRPLAPLNATGGGVPPDPSSDALWWGGFGLSEFDGPVYAMTEYHGELIVCGLFLQAGGVPAYHIARWNGQSWAPLAEGVSCEPQALQVVGDRLYVGGIDADGTLAQRNMIFAWDGASWTNVSANLSDGLVWSLTEYQGDLVAGGLFVRDEAPGVYLGVVRWDGAAWSPVGAAAPRNAHALIADGTTLYAGGYFEDGY